MNHGMRVQTGFSTILITGFVRMRSFVVRSLGDNMMQCFLRGEQRVESRHSH